MGNFRETPSGRGPFCPCLRRFALPINQIAAVKSAIQRQNGSRAGDAGWMSTGPKTVRLVANRACGNNPMTVVLIAADFACAPTGRAANSSCPE